MPASGSRFCSSRTRPTPNGCGATPSPLPILFCLGEPAVLDHAPSVAIVGTRSPTRYGLGVAAQLGSELSATGVSVVSGLAMGIDGAAHEGACAASTPPVAVVAGGLDDPYPRRHSRLWARVAERGAIVSESPAGVGNEKWRFPTRNRLLAALSDVVVVVESRPGGGSRHTVDAALARRRSGGCRAGLHSQPHLGGHQRPPGRGSLPGLRRRGRPRGAVALRRAGHHPPGTEREPSSPNRGSDRAQPSG